MPGVHVNPGVYWGRQTTIRSWTTANDLLHFASLLTYDVGSSTSVPDGGLTQPVRPPTVPISGLLLRIKPKSVVFYCQIRSSAKSLTVPYKYCTMNRPTCHFTTFSVQFPKNVLNCISFHFPILALSTKLTFSPCCGPCGSFLLLRPP